jgi:putative iron-dependent peroxidase
MSEPQPGIVPEPSPNALFSIFRVPESQAATASAARVAARVPAAVARLGRQAPAAKLRVVVGFGCEFWDRIRPKERPRGLRPFRPLQVADRAAPNTGGDLLFHILSQRRDLCFELGLEIRHQLGGDLESLDEVEGFRYLDSRDLTGFIDGTENPKGRRRARVALIGDEDPKFRGGSFVFTQRYVHDLARWNRLSRRDQEKVIGRTKRDSVELGSHAAPPTAHIRRVVIEEEGEELEIVRHSLPYGTPSQCGLFFIAYNRNQDTFEKMLARMLGATGDGHHDRLLDFTRAVSGATFFAPSLARLRGLGR